MSDFDKLTRSEKVKLLILYLCQIPLGIWFLLYQTVLPLLERDGTNLNIVYYYSAVFVIQILTAGYSLLVLYLKAYNKPKKTVDIINKIVIISAMSIALMGGLLLAYGNNERAKGMGLIFIISPGPIHLIMSMSIVLPTMLKDKSEGKQERQSMSSSILISNFINLNGIMAGIVGLSGMTLQGACIMTVVGHIFSGTYIYQFIDVPEDFNSKTEQNSKKEKIVLFARTKNSKSWKIIVLCLLSIYGYTTVIVSWTANYNEIVMNGLNKNEEEINDMIHLYTNYWAWASPISIIVTYKILEKVFKVKGNIFLWGLLSQLIICIVCLIVNTKTSLTIWGFIDPSIRVCYFGSTMVIFMEQFEGGVLIQAITLSFAGLVNYTSLLKTDTYKNSDNYLVLMLFEGIITLCLTIPLLEPLYIHTKKNKQFDSDNEQKNETIEMEELNI